MDDSRLTTHSRRAGTQKHSPVTTHHSPFTPTIAFVLGTRPEAIKLAPVVLQAHRQLVDWRPVIISTGQQRDLIGPALGAFGLAPDYELDLMRSEQSLSDLTAHCLAALSRQLGELGPNMVVIQGDTASALAGAIAAFYQRVPVAHVEAGLRTRDLTAPFPEEANRQMISRLASLHFAPTVDAKANLLAEGIDPAAIEVTGNTVVDALELLRPQIEKADPPITLRPSQRLVFVTAHRRENFGRPLANICKAICRLAKFRRDLQFVFVTHPNPAAARPAYERLAGRPRITLLPPLSYLDTLRLVASAWLIMTDSGGLQEEAPSFGRPVLVLRNCTERTEGIASGAARLVGTDPETIERVVNQLLDSATEHSRMIPECNPYGDGKAGDRIASALSKFIRCSRSRRTSTGHAA